MKLLISLVAAAACAVTVIAGSAPADAGARIPVSTDLTFDWRSEVATQESFDPLITEAAARGSVRVMVRLQELFTMDALTDPGRRAEQRGKIAAAREALLSTLPHGSYEVGYTYDDDVAYFSASMTVDALEALRDSGKAANVKEVALDAPALAQSGPMIDAPDAHALGLTGAGQTVVVLDTGVDAAHPFLGGRVVLEACFNLVTASCPPGDTGGGVISGGQGASAPCLYAPNDCGHGTHVAGIAVGANGTSGGATFSGVAPEASLVSINVFSPSAGNCLQPGDNPATDENPCPRSYEDDQIAALKLVFDLASGGAITNVAAVNMSLGGKVYTNSNACKNAELERAAWIGLLLVGENIPTVAASGNSGNPVAIAAPACIPWAVSVGSVDANDSVAVSSNSYPELSLLAPGAGIPAGGGYKGIVSSVPGGGYAGQSGTSMATPHVSGAFAVLRQKSPGTPSFTLLGNMQSTGKQITDPKNGVTTPRLRLLDALTSLGDTGFGTAYSNMLPGGRLLSGGVGLERRDGNAGSGTITIGGLLRGDVIKEAFLYVMTIGGPDADRNALVNGSPVSLNLVGASRSPCHTAGNGGATRVYLGDVGPIMTGNGTYDISGVTGSGAAEGASLVLVLQHADQPNRQVIIRHGAMTALPNETMKHTFDLTAPLADVYLHVGIGAGDGGTENEMSVDSSPFSPPDAFYGSDGPRWDDSGFYRKGTATNDTSVSNVLTTGTDCLAWAYAGLSSGS